MTLRSPRAILGETIRLPINYTTTAKCVAGKIRDSKKPDDKYYFYITPFKMEDKLRECKKCGHPKPESDFGKNNATATGRHYNCKKCVNNKKQKQKIQKALFLYNAF